MYKKIVHNIVEEHFDNQPSQVSIMRSQMPTSEIFDRSNFKTNLNATAASMASKLVAMTDAVTGTEENLIVPFEEYFAISDNFGDVTKPFYSSDLAERINMAMRSIGLVTFIAITSAKVGRDPSADFTRLNLQPENLARVMNSFNSFWPYETLRADTAKLTSALVAKIKARKDKNAAAEQTANKDVTDALKSMSDIVADGIVSQYPTRFIGM
jgi:hypothetical protein